MHGYLTNGKGTNILIDQFLFEILKEKREHIGRCSRR